jgi:hypothetical protein
VSKVLIAVVVLLLLAFGSALSAAVQPHPNGHHVLGLPLVFLGLIPFAVAFLQEVKSGKVFLIYFIATLVISITGVVLTFM